MSRPSSPNVRVRLAAAASLLLAAALVAGAVALLTGGFENGRATHGSTHATAMVHCPRGAIAVREEDGQAGEDRGNGAHRNDAVADQPTRLTCVPSVHPESFADLNAARSQLAARDTAPFATSAPGAYAHAVAQQAQIASTVRATTDTTNTWQLAGRPPECAQATSDANVCPPPSAENGQYNGVGPLGFRTLSGRISSMAYDPTRPNRLFASPVVGGVWESRDGGATWHSIGDRMATQVVGAIAYDAPRHRIIAGTGDNSFGGSGIGGHGILYSDNDGASWHSAKGIPDLALSFKVVVSPVDKRGDTVYAATSKGLFRSTDGGASYVNERLPTSPAGYAPNCAGNTTNRLCFFANDVTDVIVKPRSSPNGPAGAVIAAVGWRAGQKEDTDASGNPVMSCKLNGSPTTCLQAPQNGLYTSNTGAPGSFAYITPGGSTLGTDLPDTELIGRTALAVAHGNGQSPDAVYALIQDAQKFQGCPDVLDQVPPVCDSTVTEEGIATVLNGLFASYDFGKTWTKVMDSNQLKEPATNSSLLGQAGYSPGVQAWYNLWVDADPTRSDPDGLPTRVLFGLEEIWENNPTLPATGAAGVLTTPFAGATGGTDPYIVIGRYWNACAAENSPVPCNNNPTYGNGEIAGTTTHPDQHAYMFIPDGRGGVTFFAGSDGGAFAQHVGKDQNFSNDGWGDGLNRTISAVQPYDAEMAKDGTIVSGLQDNGEMKTAPNGHESEIFGGDAFFNTIDPGNSKNIIEEYTYAQASLTTDGGTSWYPVAPGGCSGDLPTSPPPAQFATPIEQDPSMPGHILIGCTQIQEATNAYADPCAHPDGGSASNCQLVNSPFNTVYDLSTLPSPNGADNIPSALAVRGANEYVAYCGYCDPATQSIPFANGIATNVGGSAPPQIGASDGWHKASAFCTGCHTADGKLPQRYITSIQEDPKNHNTVYVTLGGYGRRWIPPGSFGEDVSNVGTGHVFVSHDHAEHFTNITGNLPDISANWTAIHNGQLIVATDLGVYIETAPGSHRYATLGRGLPNAPVFTLRVNPGNPNQLLIATYGRGDWLYTFRPPSILRTLHCARPTGRLAGTSLGPLRLGETRAQARHALRRFAAIGYGFENYCLRAGPGIRAAVASAAVLKSLSPAQRARVRGRIVVILTANRFYSLSGVRPGTSVSTALGKLRGKRIVSFVIGPNTFYVVSGRVANYVLEARHGVVVQVGLADKALTDGRSRARRFFGGEHA